MGQAIHVAQLDHSICQQSQGPAGVSLWRLTTGQGNQVSFLAAVQLALVVALGFTGGDRRFHSPSTQRWRTRDMVASPTSNASAMV